MCECHEQERMGMHICDHVIYKKAAPRDVLDYFRMLQSP